MLFTIPKPAFLPHPRTVMLAALALALAAGFTVANWSPAQAQTLNPETAEIAGTASIPEASAKKSPLAVSLDGGTYYAAPHPDGATLSEGGSVTYRLAWTKEPQNDRPVFVKLSPVGWKGGKKAVDKRGITYSSQGHTFTADNWHESVELTINFPDNSDAHRDLQMRLVHKVGNNWKGTLFTVLVEDNDE